MNNTLETLATALAQCQKNATAITLYVKKLPEIAPDLRAKVELRCAGCFPAYENFEDQAARALLTAELDRLVNAELPDLIERAIQRAQSEAESAKRNMLAKLQGEAK